MDDDLCDDDDACWNKQRKCWIVIHPRRERRLDWMCQTLIVINHSTQLIHFGDSLETKKNGSLLINLSFFVDHVSQKGSLFNSIHTHTSLSSRSTSWIIHSLSNRFGEVGWMQNEVIVLVWNRIRNRAFCIRFRILCWHSKKILLDCSSITSMSQFKLNYSKQIECSNCESSQFDLNNPIVWLTLGPLACRALHRVITFCGMFLGLFLLALYVRWQHDPQGVYYYGNIIGPSQWTWISRAWW